MKGLQRFTLPAVLAMVLAAPGIAYSQAVATITSASGGATLSGKSLGTNSCAGDAPPTPSHEVQVTEDSNLRFTVQSEGGVPTLLIRSASGQRFCVQADSSSGGQVSIPGRWVKGRYLVYVGDRSRGQIPYTLRISGN